MDIKQLEAFVATARFRSFSKAADYLYLSQPTVSSHIRNLEGELGGPLINRRAGQFMLTDLGGIVFRKAQYLLEARDEIYSAAKAQVQSSSLGIVIAASTIPAEYLLPGLISDFLGNNGNIRFKILEKNSEGAIEMVRHDLCDMGVVGACINYDDMKYERLLDDKLVFVASGQAGYGPAISIDELRRIPFVLREERSGTYIALRDSMKAAGCDISQLNNIMVMESNEGIKGIIERNGYMACLSGFCVEKELNEGVLKKITVEGVNPRRSFYMTYLRDKPFTSIQKDFVDGMKDGMRRI